MRPFANPELNAMPPTPLPLAQAFPPPHAQPHSRWPFQCPVAEQQPASVAWADGDGGGACGLQATSWDLAQFEPVKPPGALQWLASWFIGSTPAADPGIQASAQLRGQGLLEPAKAEVRADRLLARGRAARDIVQHYAQARARGRLPGDAGWVDPHAQGQLPILLASRDELARVAFEASGETGAGPVFVLPGRGGVLVHPHAFFQQGSDRPSAHALKALQATFIHPRCSELLKLTARIARLDKDRMEEALDLLVMQRTGADSQRHLQAVLGPLVQGDETAVVNAQINPEVPPLLALSPLLDLGWLDSAVVPRQPAPEEAARELQALVVDALAHAEPQRARTRTLLRVLGPRARGTLANAFVRADMASLQRVLGAYCVVALNDVVRTWLQPVCGELDALRDLGVKVQWHTRSDSLAASLQDEALSVRIRARTGGLDLATLTQFDRETRLAGASVAIHLAMDLPQDTAAPAGRGTLPRTQVEPATGRPPLVVHIVCGNSPLAPLQPAMVLTELIAAYADGYALGASQGFARALEKDKTATGANLVVEYLCAYIGQRLAGQPLFQHHAAGATATQRVIEARASLDGIPFEQAQRDVLGLVFGERSFGSADDFRQIKRLTFSLHEQRKLDLVRDTKAGPGQGTPLHVIGGSVTTGTWVRPVGRLDDTYRVEPLTTLPAERIPGTFALGDGTLMVDPEHLVSVMLPPSNEAPAKPAASVPLKAKATGTTAASRAAAS